MFLLKVVDALEKKKVKYAIAGGYALALHGVVRGTVDVDLILNLRTQDFVRFSEAMEDLGLKQRLPLMPEQVIEFRKEYIEQRNLIAWSFVNYQNPFEIVDVLLTEDLAKINIEKINVGGKKVSVVSAQELIRMKLESARPQDILDVENLRKKLELK